MKKFFKAQYGFIFGLILFFIVTYVPLPYIVEGPGGVASLEDHYDIEGNHSSNYYLAYVSQYKGTIATVLYAWFHKDYEIIKQSYSEKTDDDVQGALYLQDAMDASVIYAYEKAGASISVSNTKYYVSYVMEGADTSLKIGDQLLLVDGNEFSSLDEIREVLSEKDSITFTVFRNDEKIECYGNTQVVDGVKKIGVGLTTQSDISVSPTIHFTFKESESGSSGGFIMSLSIYDMLVEEDIAHGLKIAGTGTIDENGTVGEIGGIEHKIMGSLHSDIDVFFVPLENYEAAMEVCDKKKCDFDLVAIHTFDDALEYLKND